MQLGRMGISIVEDEVNRGAVALLSLKGVVAMTQFNRRAMWFFISLGILFLTALLASVVIPTPGVRLAFLAWQQLVFIIGGILGSRREIFGPLPLKTVAYGLVCGLGLYLSNIITGAITVGIAGRILGNELVQELILSERAGVESLLTVNKPLIVSGVMLLLVVGAPLGEELFFRGLLVDLLNERFGAKRAIFFAALLFAALHFYVLQFIPVLLAGIILGILFIRSENIYISIIAHAVANGLTLLVWLGSL